MARLAQGKASRTARMTAAMRYRHWLGAPRPLVFEDREAGLFVDLGVAAMAVPGPLSDWVIGRLLGPTRALEGEVLARSRVVEDLLLPALQGGLPQMLVLGAGFDTTALRHAGSGCRFFEVDHPATQAAKRAILDRNRQVVSDAIYVAVDFAQDDLVSALLNAGFDPAAPTLVSWLGVTMYLDYDVTKATLAALRSILAPGSDLVFDAFPQPADVPGAERLMFGLTRAATASRGEPMSVGFDLARFEQDVAALGYEIAAIIRGDEARARWFANQPKAIYPPQSSLFCHLRASE